MLAQRAEQQAPFSRRDLGRLFVASGLLVLVMTTIFAVDIIPNQIDVGIGDVAATDILAPRTITYTSNILTAQTRDAARKAVEPQYDYTPDKASAVARQQALAFARVVAPVDKAYEPTVSEADRNVLLQTAVPSLTDDARASLMALTPSRWTEVRKESARILDQLETDELRDDNLAEIRTRLAGRILGGLNEAERKLSAEIVAPLLVANSGFDQAETERARDRAAEAISPTVVSVSQGQAIVR
jgi:membrane-associated HD superfamily phosphohydrolase